MRSLLIWALCVAVLPALAVASAPADPVLLNPEPQAGPADASAENAQRRQSMQRAPAGGVEAGVRRLSKALDLDPSQQARLRELLLNEQQQIRRVWSNSADATADRTGPTVAIIANTREQIRSLLSEEQRLKYQVTVPKEMTAPAQADVDHWLRLTQPARAKPLGQDQ